MDTLGASIALGAAALGARAITTKKSKPGRPKKAKKSTTSTTATATTKRKPGRPAKAKTTTTATATTKRKPGRPAKAKTTAATTKKVKVVTNRKFPSNKIIFDSLSDAKIARSERRKPASIYKLPNSDFFVGTYEGAMKHKRKGTPAKLGSISGVTKIG